MHNRSHTRWWLLAVAAVVVGAMVAGGGLARNAATSHQAATPTARARVLVQHFLTLLQEQDKQGLKKLLAPSFQVVRANGGVQNKASYLANPPKIDHFKISQLRGTESAGLLVATYRLTVREIIGGVPQPGQAAPRLSVFHQTGGAWRLVAHANFGAVK